MATETKPPAKQERERPALLSLEELLDLALRPWEPANRIEMLNLKSEAMYAFARWLEIQRRDFGDMMSEQAQACEILTDSIMDEIDRMKEQIDKIKAKSA